jgi:hypothetical protein
MRQLQLLGLAAQAEGLLLQRGASAMSRRLVLLTSAAICGAAALGLLQGAGWLALAASFGGLVATLVLAAVNAMVALTLFLFAGQRRPDPVAAEARALRQQCLVSLGEAPAGAGSLLRWQPLAIDLALFAAARLMARRQGR